MTPINFHKKEKPLTSLVSMGGGATGLQFGGAGSKIPYLEDVFSTYLYRGNGSTQTITNGVDVSGEDGLVWIKSRTVAQGNILQDTIRGAGKTIFSEFQNGNEGNAGDLIGSFNNNGFSVNTNYKGTTNSDSTNQLNQNYASWTFRKQKGFFDIVTYTGTGSEHNIPHNLGCVPGCIMVKCTSQSENWLVYHRGMAAGTDNNPGLYGMHLNTTTDRGSQNNTYWGNTDPTAQVFTVGTQGMVNSSGASYVAYLFAGGESTAATARSVDFDGSNDSVTIPESTDWLFEEDDFTIEFWVYLDQVATAGAIVSNMDNFSSSSQYNSRWVIGIYDKELRLWSADDGAHILHDYNPAIGQWTHYAITRETGNKFTLYKNGTNIHQVTQTADFDTNGDLRIGHLNNLGYFKGKISNLRITKGQAVYTSSFKAPSEPLTTTSQDATSSNVKVLCLNNASVTGATVTPGTITNNGASASTDSPFYDLEAFKFGEDEDQDFIKCGSYEGLPSNNPADTWTTVYLGWQPQYLIIKGANNNYNWYVLDSMRGIRTINGGTGTDGKDNNLATNLTSTEGSTTDFISLTPTGFRVDTTHALMNGPTEPYIYIAVRSADGVVGKPPEAGTDSFAMDTASSSTNLYPPNFTSNFPVEFALEKQTNSTDQWYASNRLTGKKYLVTSGGNSSNVEADWSIMSFESNIGWNFKSDWGAEQQSWMWKRGAGFDVVCYTGTTVAHSIPHSLGRAPQMIWIKAREEGYDWMVNHIGLNGGTDYQDYALTLNNDSVPSATAAFGQTVPTSTHFSVGVHNSTNANSKDFTAMLFASVKGISHCGFYDGSSGSQTITIPNGGFQPRFVIIKCVTATKEWVVIDTTRGWGSGTDKELVLNKNLAQVDTDLGAPTPTGFTVASGIGRVNDAGEKYIYYAHA